MIRWQREHAAPLLSLHFLFRSLSSQYLQPLHLRCLTSSPPLQDYTTRPLFLLAGFYADKDDLQTSGMMAGKQAVSDSALWGKHPLIQWNRRRAKLSAAPIDAPFSYESAVKASSAASGVSSPVLNQLHLSAFCCRNGFNHDEQPIGAFQSSTDHLSFIVSLSCLQGGEQRWSSLHHFIKACVTRVIQSEPQTNQVASPPPDAAVWSAASCR